MSSTLRTVAKHARVFSQRAGPSTHTRAIHSAFTAQSSRAASSPLTTPPSPAPQDHASTYTETEHTYGSRTYVVSEPPPADKRYGVPSGAYPTSAPYQTVPHNESGVGESVADRHRATPGKRGGGYGGLRMMDPAGTKGEATLGERNPPPAFGEETEKFAKAGVDGAWKLRK